MSIFASLATFFRFIHLPLHQLEGISYCPHSLAFCFISVLESSHTYYSPVCGKRRCNLDLVAETSSPGLCDNYSSLLGCYYPNLALNAGLFNAKITQTNPVIAFDTSTQVNY